MKKDMALNDKANHPLVKTTSWKEVVTLLYCSTEVWDQACSKVGSINLLAVGTFLRVKQGVKQGIKCVFHHLKAGI